MNNLKKFFAAVVLVSAFAMPAFAGGIECGVPTPPPSPATAQSEPDGSEALQAGSSEATADSVGTLTDAAFILLQGVLSLI